MLDIDKDIQRFVISAPCYFVSGYDTDNLIIHSAQPLARQEKVWDNIGTNAHSINYFIVSYKSTIKSQAKDDPNTDFVFARRISIILSIFFGKNINEHGFLQWTGLFWAPDMTHDIPNKYFYIGPLNQRPRKDLGDIMIRRADDWLNLDKLKLLQPLIDCAMEEKEFNRYFYTAGNYYLHSLQAICEDPEIAYLDLIMCGEILSNFPRINYSEQDLFDNEILDVFKRISTLENGDKDIILLKSKMMSIKKRYVKTVMHLLNDYYFNNRQNDLAPYMNAESNYVKLVPKQQADKHIKYSYDLRSKYIHSGFGFAKYIIPYRNLITEVHSGEPVVDGNDRELKNIVKYALTFVGLERMMRFCLLRFIQKYGGIQIDDRLNDDAK